MEFKWEALAKDGSILCGEGNRKMMADMLSRTDIIDIDIWWHGSRSSMEWVRNYLGMD